ncbi:hypothetical protein PQR25_34655 [Paraburkholderia nemoris]|uniref:lysozyme inhibitor LprI family protein n=1 Tax=Paraburkholderia nemoris TaxID=2793076 RepID=UPI0038B9AE1E
MNFPARKLLLSALFLALPLSATGQSIYRLTGMTQAHQPGRNDFPDISLPVNPAYSATLALAGDFFLLNLTSETTDGACAVKIKHKNLYYFDKNLVNIFGTHDKLDHFLTAKFHTNSKDWSTSYILGNSFSSACSALRYSTIYASHDEFILVHGPYFFLFSRQTHPFRDESESFDCGKAESNVEHLICRSPDLVKLDAVVNRGFVGMQMKYSKEISYQDPVRIIQLSWISNVRNKCATVECLSAVYKTRIQYIKEKISDEFPSYPAEEPDPESE